MDYIILNDDGFADENGWVRCYSTDITGEYIGQRDEYLAATTGLPAGAFLDEPPAVNAVNTVIRVNGAWIIVPDHRGETVYRTDNGQPVEITAPGPLPENTTPIKQATPYDRWDGKKWVTDADALRTGQIVDAEQQRQLFLAHANDVTTDWRTELALGIIDDNDKEKLTAWMTHIKSLKGVDTNTAPDIEWPEPPQQ